MSALATENDGESAVITALRALVEKFEGEVFDQTGASEYHRGRTKGMTAEDTERGLVQMADKVGQAVGFLAGHDMSGTVEIGTDEAKQSLVEMLYEAGIFQDHGMGYTTQAEHKLFHALLDLFRQTSMDGRVAATADDIRGFFKFLFDQKSWFAACWIFEKDIAKRLTAAAAAKEDATD